MAALIALFAGLAPVCLPTISLAQIANSSAVLSQDSDDQNNSGAQFNQESHSAVQQSRQDYPGLNIDEKSAANLNKALGGAGQSLTSREGLSGSVRAVLGLGILSLAPAILLMTTCYVRIVIVLSILRQALGGQQTPPLQVTTALALFLTILIMSPVWYEVKSEAIDPYVAQNSTVSFEQAWETGITPIKRFMSQQILAAKNSDDVWMFFKYLPAEQRENPPKTFNDVPIQVLLPAFMISELKVAFLIGFQIYLPFLVLDLIVASVTTSMGMIMLPPTMISLPLKIILFVLVDGWHLIVGMLMSSFVPYG